VPTELPVIDVSEEFMDFVFLLEDDSYLHLEFQTTSKLDDLARFLLYDARLFKKDKRNISTAVIYSGDFTDVENTLEVGSISYTVQNVYMKSFDGNEVYNSLKTKIDNGEILSQKDVLNLIFLPLMGSDVNRSEIAISAVELAKRLTDSDQKMFCIGGIIGISDKFIEKEYVKKLKEVLKMTKVAVAIREEALEQGIEQGIKMDKKQIAIKLLRRGMDIETIAELTDLSEEEILGLSTDE
jgi:predicted transposase/invertase (TIGR01784 family)